MKNIFLVLITIALGWAFHQLLPWWAIAVAGFTVGVMNDKTGWTIFAISFLGGAILWGGKSLWMNQLNDGILADKMAQLFGVGSGWMMVLITFLVGGLFAGLGGISGWSLRRVLFGLVS